MRKLIALITTAVTVVALLVILPAPAYSVTNSVTNGTFDSTINGWTKVSAAYVQAAWYYADANNSPSSGSAQLTDIDSNATSGTYWIGLSQCFPATPGTTYHISAAMAIPSGQATTGKVAALMQFYSSTNCALYTQVSNYAYGPQNGTADSHWHSGSASHVAPAGTQSVEVGLDILKNEAGGTFQGVFDNVVFYGDTPPPPSGSCTPDSTHLCLTGNRFRVSVVWYDYNNGNVAAAAPAVPFAGETGFFYFKNSSNLELMVKVHDACAYPYYHYWFFAAATTDVGYTITVTDTKTGQTEQYSNSPHVLSPAVTDQTSFSTCP